MPEFNNPVQYAIPFFIAMLALEMYLTLRHDKEEYPWKEFLASASMGLGAMVIGPLVKILTLVVFMFIYEALKEVRLSLFGYESLGWAWYVWLIAQLADDFNFYWHHRFSHSVRVLWAAHVVHHSSRIYSIGTTSVRNGWVTLFYKPIFWLWMPIVGFHPVMALTCMAINSIYQFFLHNHRVPRLGFLEKIFNTPTLHQVHHSRNLEYLDKNHGGMFIFWDKLFGTFQENVPEIKPEFGVWKEPNSYNPFVIVSHEYRDIWRDVKKAPTLSDKFKYAFYPPGWSHDNSTQTADALRAEAWQQRETQAPRPPVTT